MLPCWYTHAKSAHSTWDVEVFGCAYHVKSLNVWHALDLLKSNSGPVKEVDGSLLNWGRRIAARIFFAVISLRLLASFADLLLLCFWLFSLTTYNPSIQFKRLRSHDNRSLYLCFVHLADSYLHNLTWNLQHHSLFCFVISSDSHSWQRMYVLSFFGKMDKRISISKLRTVYSSKSGAILGCDTCRKPPCEQQASLCSSHAQLLKRLISWWHRLAFEYSRMELKWINGIDMNDGINLYRSG